MKRKPDKEPDEEDKNSSNDEDWGMFGSLMAEVLEGDVEEEVGGPSESGWRDAGWREGESDDSSLGSVLLASAWADEFEEEENDEKMMEE